MIASKLNGRNPYAVKNRFYSICTKYGLSKMSPHLKKDLEKIIEEMTYITNKRIHHDSNEISSKNICNSNFQNLEGFHLKMSQDMRNSS